MKYFTINIFYSSVKSCTYFFSIFCQALCSYNCSTSSLLLIQKCQYGKGPHTNTHMHTLFFDMMTSVLAKGSRFLSILLKWLLELEELYVCLKERKQVLEMRTLCRRNYSQSILQGLFFRSHRKKYIDSGIALFHENLFI